MIITIFEPFYGISEKGFVRAAVANVITVVIEFILAFIYVWTQEKKAAAVFSIFIMAFLANLAIKVFCFLLNFITTGRVRPVRYMEY